jgi:hypothetical protein
VHVDIMLIVKSLLWPTTSISTKTRHKLRWRARTP